MIRDDGQPEKIQNGAEWGATCDTPHPKQIGGQSSFVANLNYLLQSPGRGYVYPQGQGGSSLWSEISWWF